MRSLLAIILAILIATTPGKHERHYTTARIEHNSSQKELKRRK